MSTARHEATERFAEAVRGPEAELALDRAALLVALHAHPDLDVEERLGDLDALAATVGDASVVGVAAALFHDAGFVGNTVDYYDPENSYLDAVLDRRLGIPITLSVLMIEVGRRCDVALYGVGMPGHFLVGERDTTGCWFDAFHGGAPLDHAGCVRVFARTNDPRLFDDRYLDPVGPRAILDRMLANLQQSLLDRVPVAAAWPTRLRLQFPDLAPRHRAELAGLLGSLGGFGEAASEFELLAGELSGTDAENAARVAARFRARVN